MKLLKSYKISSTNITLKTRLIFMIIISSSIPIILVGLISYYYLFAVLTDRMYIGIQNNLSQVRIALETVLDTLNHTSQHLAFEGVIGEDLTMYLSSDISYSKKEIMDKMNTQITTIEFANTNISNITYYIQQHDTNTLKKINASLAHNYPINLKPLSINNDITFYGPHQTASRINDYKVVSITRKLKYGNLPELVVYIESGYKQIENILSKKQYGIDAYHILLNNDGYLIYSDDDSIFSSDEFIGDVSNTNKWVHNNIEYYIFTDESKYGWTIATIIPYEHFNKELIIWFSRYFFIAFVSIIISVLMAFSIWKLIYKPVVNFSIEVTNLSENNFRNQKKSMNVLELDSYLEQFHNMKNHILELLNKVEEETRKKTYLEVQQLFDKINPHFLHNTLDTIKWFADMKEQNELVQLISALNKLLHYNLGKKKTTTLKEEIDAVSDYALLQSIKYDLKFIKKIGVEEEYLNTKIPRFILQPLVENAIYHGIEGSGIVELIVERRVDKIIMKVTDNGAGMDENKVTSILNLYQANVDLSSGIGLNYVMHTIKHMYGDKGVIYVISEVGIGTTIEIILPILQEGEND